MNETERLRAIVQDERARRFWAEREYQKQKEKAAMWRRRAEDRKARIARLESEGQRRRTLRTRVRRLRQGIRGHIPSDRSSGHISSSSPSMPIQPSGESESAMRPDGARSRASSVATVLNPTIRIATLGGAALPFLSEFEIVPVADGRDVIYGADAVFVTVSELALADRSILDELGQWLNADARQPLAVWVDSEIPAMHEIQEIVNRADIRLRPPGDFSAEDGVAPFHPGFDPRVHNPVGWSSTTSADTEEADGLRVWSTAGVPVVAAATGTPKDFLGLAELLARGVPVFGRHDVDASAPLLRVGPGISAVDVAELVAHDDTLLTRMSILGRRLAFQRFTSDSRSLAFLELLHLDPPRVEPSVGAILLTNRPEYLVSSVRGILQQENASVALVVGLHGEQSRFRSARDTVERLTEDRPIQILEFGNTTSLGAALNQAAEVCACPILAKIDDDDWYGPHFIADALAALRYSGSDVVGKARYHVEIESTGDTYLIDGLEEAMVPHVIGSSLVIRRRVWEDVPFPHRPSRVDSIFLRGVRFVGSKVYATNRFEFGVRRTAAGHTWNVDPAFFAARGHRVGRVLADTRLSVVSDEVTDISVF